VAQILLKSFGGKMNSGEGQAAHPGDASVEGGEGLQRLAEEFDAAQQREFDAAQQQEFDLVDRALTQAAEAETREAAVAALVRATIGINALYVSTPTAPPLEIPFPDSYYESHLDAGRPNIDRVIRVRRKPKDVEREVEKRDKLVEKYMKVGDDLAKKFKPDQYQLSVGFPLLVSVTLVWNLNK
jgi:hypothetical protein